MGKLEKVLRIGGINYELVKESHVTTETGESLCGQIVYHKTKIKLSGENSAQYEAVTILHEALHAILLPAGLEQDERFVEAASMGIFMLLRDNPWLAKLIMSV